MVGGAVDDEHGAAGLYREGLVGRDAEYLLAQYHRVGEGFVQVLEGVGLCALGFDESDVETGHVDSAVAVVVEFQVLAGHVGAVVVVFRASVVNLADDDVAVDTEVGRQLDGLFLVDEVAVELTGYGAAGASAQFLLRHLAILVAGDFPGA
jgi:hypothetical protein